MDIGIYFEHLHQETLDVGRKSGKGIGGYRKVWATKLKKAKLSVSHLLKLPGKPKTAEISFTHRHQFTCLAADDPGRMNCLRASQAGLRAFDEGLLAQTLDSAPRL